MLRRLGIGIGVVTALMACASANKRYDQGRDLQREGRPAEAAERYIQALKKDSRLDSARAGLRSAGAEAIAAYMRTAADPATSPYAAADAYLSIDDLQRRALEVGIFLPEPSGYAEIKRAAFDRAISIAVTDARLLANRGEFAEALRRLQRAGSAYQPGSTQSNAIGVSGGNVMLAWARADTAEGRFRAAYGRVERMADVPGATAQQIDEARAMQAAAVTRGTRRVAMAPPWATLSARRDLPDEALAALGDALLDNPWLTPPQFVQVLPADQVEREVRRSGLSRRTLSVGEASRIGRSLGAEYVVVTEIDSVRREDVKVRLTRRPARTRSGVDTAYMIEEGTTQLFTRATFMLVDRDGQRAGDYRSVSATASAPFVRVRYAGDWRTLDLRQAEREQFDRKNTEHDVVRAFVEAMSPRLAEEVFAEALRRIP